MPETSTERYPESLGPGTEADAGAVRYGDTRTLAGPVPDRGEHGPVPDPCNDFGCPRCAGIPRETLASLQQAFAQKPGAGR
jgi:hypothetical protein